MWEPPSDKKRVVHVWDTRFSAVARDLFGHKAMGDLALTAILAVVSALLRVKSLRYTRHQAHPHHHRAVP